MQKQFILWKTAVTDLYVAGTAVYLTVKFITSFEAQSLILIFLLSVPGNPSACATAALFVQPGPWPPSAPAGPRRLWDSAPTWPLRGASPPTPVFAPCLVDPHGCRRSPMSHCAVRISVSLCCLPKWDPQGGTVAAGPVSEPGTELEPADPRWCCGVVLDSVAACVLPRLPP